MRPRYWDALDRERRCSCLRTRTNGCGSRCEQEQGAPYGAPASYWRDTSPSLGARRGGLRRWRRGGGGAGAGTGSPRSPRPTTRMSRPTTQMSSQQDEEGIGGWHVALPLRDAEEGEGGVGQQPPEEGACSATRSAREGRWGGEVSIPCPQGGATGTTIGPAVAVHCRPGIRGVRPGVGTAPPPGGDECTVRPDLRRPECNVEEEKSSCLACGTADNGGTFPAECSSAGRGGSGVATSGREPPRVSYGPDTPVRPRAAADGC